MSDQEVGRIGTIGSTYRLATSALEEASFDATTITIDDTDYTWDMSRDE